MEERKQKEVDYYNKEATDSVKEAGSRGGFNPFLLSSYRALQKIGRNVCHNKRVLDYGCGSGVHLHWLSHAAQSVVGVDLSEKSLEQARQKIKKEQLSNVTVQAGDCEKLSFPDSSFDVVFDGGTFSSLDLNIALHEISRVLKTGGMLVGIETLGHNPLANFKRKINTLAGTRTSWAADHIFKVQDLGKVKKYFTVVDIKFFHLVSWIMFPLVRIPGFIYVFRLVEALEYAVLTLFPFLKKYCFKIVFVLKK